MSAVMLAWNMVDESVDVMVALTDNKLVSLMVEKLELMMACLKAEEKADKMVRSMAVS